MVPVQWNRTVEDCTEGHLVRVRVLDEGAYAIAQ
jgi:hypothetical protein